MDNEYEKLVDKMVDIRSLFDDSDMEAEGHGMDDLACDPVAVACYAENKIKRLMDKVERYENMVSLAISQLEDSESIPFALDALKNKELTK